MLDNQKNLMNRFGGPRQQAPLAPMQQQRPGMIEQIGSGVAMQKGTEYANQGFDKGLEYAGHMFGPDAATAGMAEAIGGNAATGLGSQAQMLAAQNAGLEGAAGLTAEALGAGTAATKAAVAGAAEAGLAGGAGAAGAGMAAAMPWVGAGLLAGKAFGLFSEGGPVNSSELEAQAIALNNDEALEEAARMKKAEAQREAQYNAFNIDPDYKKCGGKMKYRAKGGPLYKADGGDTGGFFDYIKKSFTEKPEWENYEAVQVPVLDGSGNPTNMTSTVYRPPTQANNLEKDIARDIYGEYDDGEDMGDASYLAGDPAPYSVQTYPLKRRGEIQMKSNTPLKGGPLLRKFGAPGIRRDPQEFNRDLNEYSIKRNNRLNPQPDDGSGIFEDLKGFFKSLGQSNGDDADVSGFNMGGRVGPLKSTQYKSAGGEVYTESYYNSSKK